MQRDCSGTRAGRPRIPRDESPAILGDKSIVRVPFQRDDSTDVLAAAANRGRSIDLIDDREYAIGVFATGVAASVILIAAHDRPFMGELSVGPAPLLQVMPEPEATRTG